MITTTTNTLLSSLTVLAQVAIVLLLIAFVFKRHGIIGTIGKHGLVLSFIVALVSTLGSLTYSDVIGYDPCKLCWFQRIFMYPEVLILGIALWKKEQSLILLGNIMAIIGGVIAFLHYYLQVTGTSILPCSAVGYSVSCSQRFVMNFGYITIPLMALTGFVLILLANIAYTKTKNSKQPQLPM